MIDEIVAALAAASAPVVLAGPGVVDDGCVAGLRAFAAAGSLGVANTWGAKGVFDWRSPHHLATVGLQARDFELGGIGDADLVVATGIDEREAPRSLWAQGRTVEVPPALLGELSRRWRRPGRAIDPPVLRVRLAEVTQEGWARDGAPLAPSAATRNYATVFGEGGVVAADPGLAGYWVARTFATTELGAVRVPADVGADGFAVACAAEVRRAEPSRPVLAVVDGPPSDAVLRAIEDAARAGIAVPVEVWAADGAPLGPDEHLDRLRSVVAAGSGTVVAVAPADDQLPRMLEVAGPIVAWEGRRVRA